MNMWNEKQITVMLLALTIVMLTVGAISNRAYASINPLKHEGTPIEPHQVKQPHHFEILTMLKAELKDITTFVHIDEFSLAHKNSHV